VSQSTRANLCLGLLTAIALQACALVPASQLHDEKQDALARWNHCVMRYSAYPAHFCEGHQRDVLNAYPVHLENQIELFLSHRATEIRAMRVAQTSLDKLPEKPEKLAVDYLNAIISGAQTGDL